MSKVIDWKDAKPIVDAFRAKELTADEAVAALFAKAYCTQPSAEQ